MVDKGLTGSTMIDRLNSFNQILESLTESTLMGAHHEGRTYIGRYSERLFSGGTDGTGGLILLYFLFMGSNEVGLVFL